MRAVNEARLLCAQLGANASKRAQFERMVHRNEENSQQAAERTSNVVMRENHNSSKE